MSTASQRSKAENLARVRRNQQNCRERKRTHVADLERRVRELADQVQDCQPCPAPATRACGKQLKQALDENAALRRLLNAMGITTQFQQQYLRSLAKRDIVASALKDDADTSMLSGSFQPTSLPPDSSRSPLLRQEIDPAVEMSHEWYGGLTEGGSWLDSIPGTFSMSANDSDPTTVAPSASAMDLARSFTSFDVDPSFDTSNLAFASQSSVALANPSSSRLSERQPQITPESSTVATVCCQMEAMGPPSASESTTVCSVALSLVFDNNRKRLPITELNERLRSGFRKDPQLPQECRVENRVLFKVLAEIST